MKGHRLPTRIAVVNLATLALAVLTAAAAILWMSQALDRQAHEHSEMQVWSAENSLVAETQLLLLDYAKWEAGVPRVGAADIEWIYDNIGSEALVGRSFQVAVLWGGPLSGEVGWTQGGTPEPQSGLIDPAIIGQAEVHLRRIPLNLYRGASFYAWHRGELHVISAARFEPDAPDVIARLVSRDESTPRILLGRALTGDMVAQLGRRYSITGLEVVREVPDGAPSLPLLGADGRPVAHLVWHMPTQAPTCSREWSRRC